MNGDSVPVTFVAEQAGLGGAEAVLRAVIGHLGPDWVRGVVALEDGPLVAQLREHGANVVVVPTAPGGRSLASVPRLRSVLQALAPAVVHANGIKAAALVGLAAPRLGARRLWMRHDLAGEGLRADLVAAAMDEVVGVSHTVTRTLSRRHPGKTTVIHNGLPERVVDRPRARRRLLEVLRCQPDDPVVGLTGRLCPGKGQLELMAAAPIIMAARPQARFVLFGGEDRSFPGFAERVQALARHAGIESAVTLLGHRGDATELLAGCDVAVVPSVLDPAWGWREGFGLAAVEALQAGTPVVAYASGSLPEILGDAALLVPEGDRQALATRVVQVLADPGLREDLSQRGRQRAACYRLEDAVEALADRYRLLARGAP